MKNQDFLIEKDKKKLSFLKTQTEKNYYLGEYRERVIRVLTKQQVLENGFYEEIIEEMNLEEAYILKLSRELDLKKIKDYLKAAERKNIKYELVDGISYTGDVAIVLASKKALKEEKEIYIDDIDENISKAGLNLRFSRAKGKKICKNCYKDLSKALPEYKKKYEKQSIFERIIGDKCPVCKK